MRMTFFSLAVGLLVPAGVQAQYYGAYGGAPGPQMAMARVDDKGAVHVRQFVATPALQMTYARTVKGPGGREQMMTFSAQHQTVVEDETIVPAKAVEAFSTDGKPIPAARLAELLAKEARVLIVEGEPKAKDLEAYRKDLVVLSVALPPPYPGWGYGPPAGGPPQGIPIEPGPPPKPRPGKPAPTPPAKGGDS
jgi:hypothetical protein